MPAQSGKVAEIQNPPVRVFTLGRFDVEVDHAPLRFGRKAQRRPLDLLKLLIAYGGEGVSDEQIAEDLWPDAEGDAALTALRTTLSRLRRLIGARSVVGNLRRLTLNPELCWVDALTVERSLAASRRSAQTEDLDAALVLIEEARELYRGVLLPGESRLSPVVSARARLHSLFLRCLAEVGQRCESAGQADKAMDLYRGALEIDEAAEDIARRLMQCCRSTGRAAEGIAVYRRCEAALNRQLGAAPSVATQGAYQNLLATPSTDPRLGELTVAVLRFQDLSPGRGHQRLADAVRETVISLLDAVPELSLVTSDVVGVPWHVAPDPGVRQRGQAVRYLLRGSVLVSGNRLRTGVELIDARTGLHAWSEQLDQELDDVIRAHDRIAVEMADGLAGKLVLGDVGQLLLSPNVHVWKALAQARMLLDRHTRQDHQRARALIGRMLEIEGKEPLIRGLLAITHVIESWKCWTANPAASLHATEKELRELRRRYGRSAQGLHALSWVCALRGDIDEALRIARRNIDWMPENFNSHAFLGLPLAYQGQYAHALDKLNDAFRARPQPLHWMYKDRAAIQFCMGRYDEAAQGLERMLVDEYPLHRDADLLSARLMYVGSLAAAGRGEQARHEATAVLAAYPTASAHGWSRWHFRPYRDDAIASRMERLLVDAGLPL